MHYTERQTAVARIGRELRARGWALFGYTEDRSDIRTDYYAPASWQGVATHSDYPDVVVCVDVSNYTVQGRKDNWPAFQATPHGKTWHVERNGQIVKTGVGLSPCAEYGHSWKSAVGKLVDKIEHAAKPPDQAPNTTANTGSYIITIKHDRDWTWLHFSAKPPAEVRDRLKAMKGRWSRKRQAWYFQRNVPDEELSWLAITHLFPPDRQIRRLLGE